MEIYKPPMLIVEIIFRFVRKERETIICIKNINIRRCIFVFKKFSLVKFYL